jgi:hypothetical protein
MQHGQGWIGRKDRVEASVAATAHGADGTAIPVTITNMSDEGCRIECDHTFVIGEHFCLAVPGLGPISAQVRWALAGSAGARFLNDIPQQG